MGVSPFTESSVLESKQYAKPFGNLMGAYFKSDNPTGTRAMSRPSKFKPEFIAQAEKLCRLGATDMELADFFDVEVRTLYRWKADNEQFCQALKSGKNEADDRVERSLYARANGYEHDEVDIRVVQGGIVQTPIRKYYPPDTTAAIFWLKNRRAAEWRETKAVELTGEGGGPVLNEIVIKVVDAG